jgi:hypothetical protein
MSILDIYPSPEDFEKAAYKAAYGLSSEQREDLHHHLRVLGGMLYGEKETYWEQFKLLEAEAEFIFKKGKRLPELEKEEVKELLSKVEIMGIYGTEEG